MRRGGILAIAIVLLAAAGALGVVAWLRQLQKVAAQSAAAPCVIPEERSCGKDVDCVEVRCVGECVCNEDCGVAVSRSVLMREHHVCLVAAMEPRVPVGCREQRSCKCVSYPCQKIPACLSGRCEMVADGLPPRRDGLPPRRD